MEEEAKARVPFIIGVAGGSASGKVLLKLFVTNLNHFRLQEFIITFKFQC
jgi:uridine kinase